MSERNRDDGYYGYPSERAFNAAYENEVYCRTCESHPCRCDNVIPDDRDEADTEEWERRR